MCVELTFDLEFIANNDRLKKTCYKKSVSNKFVRVNLYFMLAEKVQDRHCDKGCYYNSYHPKWLIHMYKMCISQCLEN